MKAVFCGSGSLLVQCAAAYTDAGGAIVGVISTDPALLHWAETTGYAVAHDPTADVFSGRDFEHLFSVGQLTVLPQALIERATELASNFHDGPLPGRAGLNVPAWALLEGETEHGIVWHQMTGAVDRGPVLVARQFPILSDDTAFRLNARCYDEGLSAFRDLLVDLRNGQLASTEQHTSSTWHGASDRPSRLGLLDPSASVVDGLRLTAALDFGPYPNPLALPKLWTGTRLLVFRSACRTATPVLPGRVGPVGPEGIVLGLSDGAVRIWDLFDIEGRPLVPGDTGLTEGAQLSRAPELPDALRSSVGKAEGHWRRLLVSAEPALPPFPRLREGKPGTHILELSQEAAPEVLAAAWVAWCAGLTGSTIGTLSLTSKGEHPCLSDLCPLTMEVEGTPADMVRAATDAMEAARNLGPMSADLPLRLGSEAARDKALAALSMVMADELPHGADVSISAEPARLEVSAAAFAPETARSMARAFSAYLSSFQASPEIELAALPLGTDPDLSGPEIVLDDALTIPDVLAEAVRAHASSLALEHGSQRLTFAELEDRAEALAAALVGRGAKPGMVVGIGLPRSIDLVVALYAVLKTGAAYLPLDPEFPIQRLRFILDDARAGLVITRPEMARRLDLTPEVVVAPDATERAGDCARASSDDMAYLIYTSGSTGQPKGVKVSHRSVVNFFAAMGEKIPMSPGARLLAVTSVSFDISVLEIFWTLSLGATVVLPLDGREEKRPDFSLFYFASESAGTGSEEYRLLTEGARFADTNGFSAVWTPERHFHAFGGLFPNPAITAGMLAGITENVQLRAGSTVLPLHHPVRVAEDWALVDNLSNGRAGLALASGWQPNDFLLRPEVFETRKKTMLEGVETLRGLWRGETRAFPGPDGAPVEIEVHPRCVQSEIPLWLTAAGNPETFEAAGQLGCGVLTHLLGQTFDEVAEKIRVYRAAWRQAGHAGEGHVVLMLHTFIGETEEAVLAAAKGPMKAYLKSAVDLVRRAAWSFPTIVERAASAGGTVQDVFDEKDLTEEETDQLLEHAFERYYGSAGLFGTPETAREIVDRVSEIGVDEIGCLIDFGIETDTVLASLPNIRRLMDLCSEGGRSARSVTVSEDLSTGQITHFQCTPSMAEVIVGDPEGRAAIGQLTAMMVGGEALPPDLGRRLLEAGPDVLFNMYGPTETTIWSSVARLERLDDRVPLGEPIANTVLSVRSPDGRRVPALAEGELWISGAGVAQGYLNRPELTAERFIETTEGRAYRSGDLVRRHPTGEIEFLGRVDGQLKIRGHRIETGEIETALADEMSVRMAVVRAVTRGEDTRLVAYITPGALPPNPAELKSRLAQRLPEVMVPSEFVVLSEMPLTPNGKIDRKALPEPPGASANENLEQAADSREETIAAIWADALGLSEISVTGNFFDLGGHSLLVVQVQRQMNERLGTAVSITDLFRYPTVRAISKHLGTGSRPDQSAAARGSARAAARRQRMSRR